MLKYTFKKCTLHYVTSEYITLCHLRVHYIMSPQSTLHYVTSEYITLCHLRVHCIMSPQSTLHYVLGERGTGLVMTSGKAVFR